MTFSFLRRGFFWPVEHLVIFSSPSPFSPLIFFLWLFSSCSLSWYVRQRSKILEHRYFSESSVRDLDHKLRQNFNIAPDLTKLNTSKQHWIKFIFNKSPAGINYWSQRRNLANDF
jgi:hypothetical protein